jgi:vacuolar-type H+-ATPase subunit H
MVSGAGHAESVGGHMQKLEEILRVEEAARHAVLDARGAAEATVREAELQAQRIVEESRQATVLEAASLRDAALSEAHEQASSVRSEAEGSLERELQQARGRMDAAVAAALGELVG